MYMAFRDLGFHSVGCRVTELLRISAFSLSCIVSYENGEQGIGLGMEMYNVDP